MLEKFNAFIEQYVQSFDSILTVEEDPDSDGFYYDHSTNTVIYSLYCDWDDEAPAAFINNIRERCLLAVDVHPFFIALLHEIGHHITRDQVSNNTILRTLVQAISDNDKRRIAYYHMPDEWAATEWAIDYINNNSDTVYNLAIQFNEVLALD